MKRNPHTCFRAWLVRPGNLCCICSTDSGLDDGCQGRQALHPARHKENVQWGWFDVNEKPKLTVESGDTVSIETWYHVLDQLKPKSTDHTLEGPPMDKIAGWRKENDGGGPHSITGPIYVNGAEPGDTLEIRILKIVPKEYGQNFNLPGKDFPTGLLPKEFPEGFVPTISSTWRR